MSANSIDSIAFTSRRPSLIAVLYSGRFVALAPKIDFADGIVCHRIIGYIHVQNSIHCMCHVSSSKTGDNGLDYFVSPRVFFFIAAVAVIVAIVVGFC